MRPAEDGFYAEKSAKLFKQAQNQAEDPCTFGYVEWSYQKPVSVFSHEKISDQFLHKKYPIFFVKISPISFFKILIIAGQPNKE